MKLEDYRNPEVQARLDRAAKTWLLNDPKRSFQEPEAISVSQMIKWFLLGVLLCLVILALWASQETGRLFLAVLFPFVAIRAFLKIASIQAAPGSSEVTHLLPFDDRTLSRQARRDFRRPLIEGLMLSFLLGAFGAEKIVSLTGAFQGPLIFLGLLGWLILSYFWRFFEIYTLLGKSCVALFCVGLVLDPVKSFNRSLLEATPWFQAFTSPLALVLFLTSGASIAWFTRNRWSKVTRFNRTSFYEDAEETELEIETEGMPTMAYDQPPPQTHPKGLVERLLWHSLTLKERGLLRAVGGQSTNFLSAWIKTTFVFLLVLWLTRFNWPPPIGTIRIVAPLLSLIAMTLLTGLCTSAPTRYLHAIAIGPQATAARFQTLPLSLTALEKLMWKEGLCRWLLMALTLAVAPLIYHASEATLQSLPANLLVALLLILHVFWLHFWNSSINGWAPRNNRGRGWVVMIEIVITLGILFTIGSSVFFITIFQGAGAPWLSMRGGIFVAIIVGYQAILRLLVRAFISDTRSDLIRQA